MLTALRDFRDNRRAIVANLALIGSGLLLACLSGVYVRPDWISPLPFMVLLGAGLYLAYTPYNGLLRVVR